MNSLKILLIVLIGAVLYWVILLPGIFVKNTLDEYVQQFAGFQIELPHTKDKVKFHKKTAATIYEIETTPDNYREIESKLQNNSTVISYSMEKFRQKDFFQPLYQFLTKINLLDLSSAHEVDTIYVRYKSHDFRLRADVIIMTPTTAYLIVDYHDH